MESKSNAHPRWHVSMHAGCQIEIRTHHMEYKSCRSLGPHRLARPIQAFVPQIWLFRGTFHSRRNRKWCDGPMEMDDNNGLAMLAHVCW